MILNWIRAKSAEFDARRVTAQVEAQLAEQVEATYSSGIQTDIDFHAEMGWSTKSKTQIVDEQTHREIQQRAYDLYYTNPWARAVVSSLERFVAGRGFNVLIGDGDKALQEKYDEWERQTRFKRRVREMIGRSFRDGEVFLRRIQTREGPTYRFITPTLVRDLDGRHTFGIETDPRDVETPLRYYVVRADNKNELLDGRPIPAEEILHVKIDVDSEIKRGMTILKPILWVLPQIPKILESRLAMHRLRTAIVAIKRVKGGPSKLSTLKTAQEKDRGNTFDTSRQKMPKPGTILYATDGVDYEFKGPQFDAQDALHDIRFFLLACVAGSGLAEYMVTGDSSNANYASTMVAESPAVRAFEGWQDWFDVELEAEVRNILGVLTKSQEPQSIPVSVEWPPLVHRNFPEESKAFVLLRSDGLVSKRTARAKLGLSHRDEEENIAMEEPDEPTPEERGMLPGQDEPPEAEPNPDEAA